MAGGASGGSHQVGDLDSVATGSRRRPELEVPIVAEQRRRVLEVAARGRAVLASRSINRSTAFTHEERAALGLTGLLPGAVSTIEDQLQRVHAQYEAQPTHLAKNVYLQLLRDRNEVLFFRLLADHLEEMLPIVYTPTVGEAIRALQPRVPPCRAASTCPSTHPEDIEVVAARTRPRADEVDLIVATDAEGILGHRRLGRRRDRDRHRQARRLHRRRAASTRSGHPGGAGRRHRQPGPARRPAVRRQPSRPGPRPALRRLHRRVRADASRGCSPTRCCTGRTSAPSNAGGILDAGTRDRSAPSTTTCRAPAPSSSPRRPAAVARGRRPAARPAGRHLRRRYRRHRDRRRAAATPCRPDGLSDEEATGRFYALGRRGLLTQDLADRMRDFQVPYARTADEVEGWAGDRRAASASSQSWRTVNPTMLIGTSPTPGPSPRTSCARWRSTSTGRSSCRCPTRRRCPRRSRRTCSRWTDGRAWSPPAARSSR